ncbi:hypothetical protein L1049_010901 [Liquidambar formosana]|uniref:Aminotransferase-like plant mobile domain-containing protein n=1 Tax=Liquidambar formosana TaxID=63359 RepID=A0AAP0RQE4_LIQFO
MNHAQPRARKIIKKAGFEPFLDALWNEQWDRQALFALTELWWDTTNTFHFSFGEMTMTPKDFTMITGLSLKGKRLDYYEHANMDQNYIVALLGVEAELSPKGELEGNQAKEKEERREDPCFIGVTPLTVK